MSFVLGCFLGIIIGCLLGLFIAAVGAADKKCDSYYEGLSNCYDMCYKVASKQKQEQEEKKCL